MKNFIKMIFSISFVLLLSACLYPEDQLAKNQVPYKDQINSVQYAVNQYKKDNQGILPIKTRDVNTPIYQKYPIDFQQITPRYIQEPPGNSFEAGGIFQYVLVDVEANPTVKLIDLLTVEPIRELKLRIMFYRDKNGYPPFKKQISNGVYTLDYKALGYDKDVPYVESPYSKKNLSLVVDGEGKIYVDYRPDLYEALKKFNHNYENGEDIREILVNNYDFVPVYSLPYTVKNNEPIFMVRK